jgi:hypothetical protein
MATARNGSAMETNTLEHFMKASHTDLAY